VRLYEIFSYLLKIDKEPSNGLWFRHESPYELQNLQIPSYDQLEKIRPGYNVKARRKTEDLYRNIIDHSKDLSFLYATIVGYNIMEPSIDYPGFTYYFQLTHPEIENCIFTIVDKKEWMNPTVGTDGLQLAQHIWQRHKSQFEKYNDKELGSIDPRIEVIIPFPVNIELYFPQIEDR